MCALIALFAPCDNPQNADKAETTRSQHNITTFADIASLLDLFEPPDHQSREDYHQLWNDLAMPRDALGRLQDLALWFHGWQPALKHPRVAVFVARHGVTAANISPYPQSIDRNIVHWMRNGQSAINAICANINCDLRVYEMDLDTATADFRHGVALGERECAHAIAYGMMTVEQGIDLLVLGEVGIGNTTAAAALCMALWGGDPHQWVGHGSGASEAMVQRKRDVVTQAHARHRDHIEGNPWKALAAFGGREMAAIVGAVIAARIARVPVLLDGYAVCSAASVLHKVLPQSAMDHCFASHVSRECGHGHLLRAMAMDPCVDLNLALGEGSGAALVLMLLQSALAVEQQVAKISDLPIAP